MNRHKRRIIFGVLTLVFFVAGPLLIAYATGYTFDLGRGSFVKTGGVFIKSSTARLSLFLNGEFAKETSLISGGALLTDLVPGDHLFRIEKSGYAPWSKKITVEPHIVTEFRDIALVPMPSHIATSSIAEQALITADLALDHTPNADAIKYRIEANGDLIATADEKVLAQNVRTFNARNDVILFIDRNGFLARLVVASGDIVTLGRPGFFLSDTEPSFIYSPTREIAIIDSGGGLFILDASHIIRTITGGVREVAFDLEGDKLLIVKEHSLNLMWTRANEYQPFQKQWTIETLIEAEAPILEAAWFHEDSAHVVFRTAEEIFFAEIDGRGGRNTHLLLSNQIDGLATLPQLPDTVFFLKEKMWYKIELQ